MPPFPSKLYHSKPISLVFSTQSEEKKKMNSKISAVLLIYMLFISSAIPIFGCGACGKPQHKPKGKHPKDPTTLPPYCKAASDCPTN